MRASKSQASTGAAAFSPEELHCLSEQLCTGSSEGQDCSSVALLLFPELGAVSPGTIHLLFQRTAVQHFRFLLENWDNCTEAF